jgi:hypothetical protein
VGEERECKERRKRKDLCTVAMILNVVFYVDSHDVSLYVSTAI